MKTIYVKDPGGKKITVTREFDAPVEKVWPAWTEKELLDQWWAPLPWKAETKQMNFKEGGQWLYCMVGPQGERQWCKVEYEKIIPLKLFTGTDAFCDEKGNALPEPPGMEWKVNFHPSANGTRVEVEITFASEKDLKTIVEMGFEQGFAMAHDNLDKLLNPVK